MWCRVFLALGAVVEIDAYGALTTTSFCGLLRCDTEFEVKQVGITNTVITKLQQGGNRLAGALRLEDLQAAGSTKPAGSNSTVSGSDGSSNTTTVSSVALNLRRTFEERGTAGDVDIELDSDTKESMELGELQLGFDCAEDKREECKKLPPQRVVVKKTLRILDRATVGAGGVLEMSDDADLQVDGELEVQANARLILGRTNVRASNSTDRGVVIRGTLEIADGETQLERDVVIEAGGRAAFQGNGTVRLRAGAVLSVRRDAIFSVGNNSQTVEGDEGTAMENDGTMEVDMKDETQEITFRVPLRQNGRLDVRRGNVVMDQGIDSQGSMQINAGSRMQLRGASVFRPINTTDGETSHKVEGVLEATDASTVKFESNVESTGQIRVARGAQVQLEENVDLRVGRRGGGDESKEKHEQRMMQAEETRNKTDVRRLLDWVAATYNQHFEIDPTRPVVEQFTKDLLKNITTAIGVEVSDEARENVDQFSKEVAWVSRAVQVCKRVLPGKPSDRINKDEIVALLEKWGVTLEAAEKADLKTVLNTCAAVGRVWREAEIAGHPMDGVPTARRVWILKMLGEKLKLDVGDKPADINGMKWLLRYLYRAWDKRDGATEADKGLVVADNAEFVMTRNSSVTVETNVVLGRNVKLAGGSRVRARHNATISMRQSDSSALSSDSVTSTVPELKGEIEIADGAVLEMDAADVKGEGGINTLNGGVVMILPPITKEECADDKENCAAAGVSIGRELPSTDPAMWTDELKQQVVREREARRNATRLLRIRQLRRDAGSSHADEVTRNNADAELGENTSGKPDGEVFEMLERHLKCKRLIVWLFGKDVKDMTIEDLKTILKQAGFPAETDDRAELMKLLCRLARLKRAAQDQGRDEPDSGDKQDDEDGGRKLQMAGSGGMSFGNRRLPAGNLRDMVRDREAAARQAREMAEKLGDALQNPGADTSKDVEDASMEELAERFEAASQTLEREVDARNNLAALGTDSEVRVGPGSRVDVNGAATMEGQVTVEGEMVARKNSTLEIGSGDLPKPPREQRPGTPGRPPVRPTRPITRPSYDVKRNTTTGRPMEEDSEVPESTAVILGTLTAAGGTIRTRGVETVGTGSVEVRDGGRLQVLPSDDEACKNVTTAEERRACAVQLGRNVRDTMLQGGRTPTEAERAEYRKALEEREAERRARQIARDLADRMANGTRSSDSQSDRVTATQATLEELKEKLTEMGEQNVDALKTQAEAARVMAQFLKCERMAAWMADMPAAKLTNDVLNMVLMKADINVDAMIMTDNEAMRRNFLVRAVCYMGHSVTAARDMGWGGRGMERTELAKKLSVERLMAILTPLTERVEKMAARIEEAVGSVSAPINPLDATASRSQLMAVIGEMRMWIQEETAKRTQLTVEQGSTLEVMGNTPVNVGGNVVVEGNLEVSDEASLEVSEGGSLVLRQQQNQRRCEDDSSKETERQCSRPVPKDKPRTHIGGTVHLRPNATIEMDSAEVEGSVMLGEGASVQVFADHECEAAASDDERKNCRVKLGWRTTSVAAGGAGNSADASRPAAENREHAKRLADEVQMRDFMRIVKGVAENLPVIRPMVEDLNKNTTVRDVAVKVLMYFGLTQEHIRELQLSVQRGLPIPADIIVTDASKQTRLRALQAAAVAVQTEQPADGVLPPARDGAAKLADAVLDAAKSRDRCLRWAYAAKYTSDKAQATMDELMKVLKNYGIDVKPDTPRAYVWKLCGDLSIAAHAYPSDRTAQPMTMEKNLTEAIHHIERIIVRWNDRFLKQNVTRPPVTDSSSPTPKPLPLWRLAQRYAALRTTLDVLKMTEQPIVGAADSQVEIQSGATVSLTGFLGSSGAINVRPGARLHLDHADVQRRRDAPMEERDVLDMVFGDKRLGQSVDADATKSDVTLESSTLTGSGFLNARFTRLRNATLAPGNSPGFLVVGGDFEMDSSSTLEVEVEGEGEGQFDVVDVQGQAKLGGTLRVTTSSDFTSTGANLNFLSAAEISNSFDAQTGSTSVPLTISAGSTVTTVSAAPGGSGTGAGTGSGTGGGNGDGNGDEEEEGMSPAIFAAIGAVAIVVLGVGAFFLVRMTQKKPAAGAKATHMHQQMKPPHVASCDNPLRAPAPQGGMYGGPSPHSAFNTPRGAWGPTQARG